MTKGRIAVALLLLAGTIHAQAPANQPNDIYARSVNLLLQAPPEKVSLVSTGLVGNPGPQTYYYWIVTNALYGSSTPAGPFVLLGAPNTLSGTNYVTVNWTGVPSGLTYDVLRTTTPAMPGGACACAVATAQAGGPVNDQSNTLGAYTVSPTPISGATISLTNESSGSAVSRLTLRAAGKILLSMDTTGKLTSSNINNTLFADQFTGVDMCAQIAAAIASLPATGGTVNATAYQGAQNCASNPFAGNTKPIRLLLGHMTTITSTVGWTLNSTSSIETPNSENITTLSYSGTGIALDLSGANDCLVINLTIKTTNDAGSGIKMGGGSQHCKLEHVFITGSQTITNTGTGLLLDGQSTGFSSNLSNNGLYIIGYKFGVRFTAFSQATTWTAVIFNNCFVLGNVGNIIAGSKGVWVDANSNVVGGGFYGGAIEGFAVGYQVDTAGAGFPFFADNESNTVGFSFGTGQYPLVEINGSQGFLGTLAITDPSVIGTGLPPPALIFKGTGGTNSTAANIYMDNTSANTGKMQLQAGGISAGFGGGLTLFGHSSASNPGWVVAGISTGSGGKFAVNTSGVGATGSNVFTVDSSGNTVASTLNLGGGSVLAKYSRFSVTQTPALVGANTCAAQSFTVTGVAAADVLIAVGKPTEQAGLSITPGHVTGANTLTVNFCNNTAAGITPTASETYQFVVVQ